MLPNGYMGKILRVDLSNKKTVTDPLGEDQARIFFGGRCLTAKMLFDELEPKTDPLGAENLLIFGTGPLTGSGVPSGNRYVITTKSPQTNMFLDSYAGGHFGSEIKFAGYDIVVIKGKSEAPVYLSIDDGTATVKNASGIWGLDCWEAEKALKQELGDECAKTSVIGPAGENLVRYASVSNELFHQCGRGGVGAVMGSKRLKGIVARGSKGVRPADPVGLMNFLKIEMDWKLTKGPFNNLVKDIKFYTPGSVESCQELGLLPTFNFQQGQFEDYKTISGHYMRERIVAKDKACFSCNTPCNKYSVIKEGKYSGGKIGGPEYETLALLGSNTGINNIEAVAHANILCDRYGLDTISTGNVIAFITECRSRNLVSKESIDNLDLEFGNEDAIMTLISKIAKREGIGNLLADGVKEVSKKVGKGSEKFAMHVKGMEYAGYVAGASPAFALEFAVTDRGGCHRRGWPVYDESSAGPPYGTEGRAQLIKRLFDQRIPLHCGIVCDLFFGWSGSAWDEFKKMTKCVTGLDMTDDYLQTLSERCFAITRAFNVREGARRSDDSAPFRTMEEAQPVGPAKGKKVTKEMLDKMLDEYYTLRNWDPATGIPTGRSLENLGLEDVKRELSKQIAMP
jgi:aldehyde:ferredoxin oxidoreductase